uniref:hypothetical protein n=1 Tax=Glutamicibacter sp. TaxID=1931995 RepID=UPI0028BD3B17
MNTDKMDPNIQEQEAELSADLEDVWQEESQRTAAATETADEVDGQLRAREDSSMSVKQQSEPFHLLLK